MKSRPENYYKDKIVTVPNVLSVVRLILIPIFVWLYCFKHEYIAATAILVVSGLTDIVDGFIARKFKMISDVGKILDPIADKLTQLTVLICLVVNFPFMLIPAFLLTVKEVLNAVMGFVRVKSTRTVHMAVWHGKLNTFLLYTVLALHVIWGDIPFHVSTICIISCSVMMVVSSTLYSIEHVNVLKNNKNDK